LGTDAYCSDFQNTHLLINCQVCFPYAGWVICYKGIYTDDTVLRFIHKIQLENGGHLRCVDKDAITPQFSNA